MKTFGSTFAFCISSNKSRAALAFPAFAHLAMAVLYWYTFGLCCRLCICWTSRTACSQFGAFLIRCVISLDLEVEAGLEWEVEDGELEWAEVDVGFEREEEDVRLEWEEEAIALGGLTATRGKSRVCSRVSLEVQTK